MQGMIITCAWRGCGNSYDCRKGQPQDWQMLLMHHEQQKVFFSGKLNRQNGTRDDALCPQHVGTLNGLLKGISGA